MGQVTHFFHMNDYGSLWYGGQNVPADTIDDPFKNTYPGGLFVHILANQDWILIFDQRGIRRDHLELKLKVNQLLQVNDSSIQKAW